MDTIQKIINRLVDKLDVIQKRYSLTSFIYAVIKKYGEDKAGYQSALLTYYGFFVLFPLLLVLTTIAGIVSLHNPQIQASIINSMTNYFPILGNQLSSHIHSLHKTGLALIVGIIFSLYGARGVADVFRHGVQHVWHEAPGPNDGFPVGTLKSLKIMLIGGLGLSAGFNHSRFCCCSWPRHTVSCFITAAQCIYLILVVCVFNTCQSGATYYGQRNLDWGPSRSHWPGLLQTAGGYLLARELKSLDALYSNFAIALGLLFWIYLQSQMLYYGVTAAAVSAKKLWPRSIHSKNLTPADKRAKNN